MSHQVPVEPTGDALSGPTQPTVARFAPLLLVAIGITVLAWASAFIVIRGLSGDFEAGSLALGRLVVGAVLLGLYTMRRRWVRPTAREWMLVVGFGVLWFGAYNIALNLAEQTIDAGTTAMLVNIGPILIAVGAGVFLREGIPRWLVIGAAVAFSGVIVIGVSTTSGSVGDATGVALCIVAALTYAAGVLMQKPALRRLPSAQLTWLGCTIGAVVCLPFSGQLVADLSAAPPSSILGMVYLGAVPTALAFSTWGYALSRVPAGQLGVSTYVVPPLTILLGWVVLGEVPAALAVVGGAICLLGVALSRRRPRARSPRPTNL